MLVDNEINPEKYTKDELAKNKKSADAAYAYAHKYTDGAYVDKALKIPDQGFAKKTDAEKWLSRYFELSGEEKQDYIDQINKDNAVRELDLITKAVCEYKCVLPEDELFKCIVHCDIKRKFYSWFYCVEELLTSPWVYVCNELEFNAHMEELSGCPVALKEWQEGLKAQNNSESDIVYHEGKGYEVGAIYEFSDDGLLWDVGILTGNNSDDEYPSFESDGLQYVFCRKSKREIGGITEQSIELINGNGYCFDYNNNGPLMKLGCHGVYKKKTNQFIISDGVIASEYCTNIQPLTPAK